MKKTFQLSVSSATSAYADNSKKTCCCREIRIPFRDFRQLCSSLWGGNASKTTRRHKCGTWFLTTAEAQAAMKKQLRSMLWPILSCRRRSRSISSCRRPRQEVRRFSKHKRQHGLSVRMLTPNRPWLNWYEYGQSSWPIMARN